MRNEVHVVAGARDSDSSGCPEGYGSREGCSATRHDVGVQ